MTEEEDNCCHNQSEYVKLELDQLIRTIDLRDMLPDLFKDFSGFLCYLNPLYENGSLPFNNYKPPAINFDFQQLFQVFLC